MASAGAIKGSGMCVLLIAAGASHGQGLVPSAQTTPTTTVKRIEPGGRDTNPISGQGRLIPVDLRLPSGFEGVYEVTQTDRYGNTQKYFARSSGGLTALFPRSQYVEGRGGLLAQVPAGTVFNLTGLSDLEAPLKPVGPRPPNWLDLSAKDESEPVDTGPSAVPQPYPAYVPSIWEDERYRQRRMGTLLKTVDHR